MRRGGLFALALFTAVLVSYELALSLPIFGAGPDLIVLVTVAFSTGERPARAAAYGFAAGLLRDLLLTTPRGISAFSYAVTAYSVGMLGEVRGVWALIGMTAGATLVSQTLFGFGVAVLSQNASLGSLPRVALTTTAYNTVIAPFLIPLLRRVVTPRSVREGTVA